ncbi:glycoside hydrolase family 16 protein [Proteiniphilum propionicum]|jgi:beta-glucanase (GH16 family)|uniref:glycoside hydrolase family 16 protein n=1 Tax=Proteiniphilum propionicum TaxID=2829812 RepID=UPI001EEA1B66|nr:glycoside hydrolase family 16 protein [Proteiniphilum propionicum]ULB33264.1 glycoside hydrolase family 16 protein [Proteiniphilum propionicum]
MKRNILQFTILLLLASFFSCSDKKDDPEKYRKGWILVWEDNFTDSSDPSVWKKIPRGKHPMNKYMSENSFLYIHQDGNLVLRGMQNLSESSAIPFLTGGITREGFKENETGRIEIRASINPASGAWTFIRLLPENRKENIAINIMEQYNYDDFIYQSVTTEYTTIKKMTDNPPSTMIVGVNPARYHIYGVEKYPDSLVFYVDGVRTRKYPRILTQITGQFPFNDQDLNLHIGICINKETDSDALPVDMFIDWVRYYKQIPPTEGVMNDQ